MGQPVAVLVRSSRLESARGRVETILARWESQLGHLLPRPVVLEGDICQEDLGLDVESRQWVRHNCRSLLHSAASLSFEADEATNEPWRSNFEGTRHVQEFARRVEIRHFHHVSTAYVCGLRTGQILESDVDVGQTLGNAYEQSKLSAEKLIRESDGFDRLTVYRPAIIVGDSRTGYTTTYHGFYTPLKVVHSLVGKVAPSEMNILLLLQALGLTGQERKNFVPVDWVSSVMTRILLDESLHGETYHLTPRHRVSIDDMTAVLSDAIQTLSIPALQKQSAAALDGGAFEEVFRTQMQTYQSYWRDDPEFDTSNTSRAVPQLPCPEVDAAMMWRLAKYAIESNFGWPIPPPVPAPLDIHGHLMERAAGAERAAQGSEIQPANSGSENQSANRGSEIQPANRLVLEVAGPGGGEWTLELWNDVLTQVGVGSDEDTAPRIYMSARTFQRLSTAEISAAEALRNGALVVLGACCTNESLLPAIDRLAGRGADHRSGSSSSRRRALAG